MCVIFFANSFVTDISTISSILFLATLTVLCGICSFLVGNIQDLSHKMFVHDCLKFLLLSNNFEKRDLPSIFVAKQLIFWILRTSALQRHSY